jgi:hypothetical protein
MAVGIAVGELDVGAVERCGIGEAVGTGKGGTGTGLGD